MKKLLYLPVLIGTLLFLGCEKDDDPQDDAGNYQTPLPAATTYGAGTFACYVDGKAYIAKKNDITAFYQFYQGEYSLSVQGEWSSSEYLSVIRFHGNKEDILLEGNTYLLEKPILGGNNLYGSLFFKEFGNWYNTNDEQTGELKITKFDEINGILSGTFWFNVKRPDGQIVEIRDGRFDVKYAS